MPLLSRKPKKSRALRLFFVSDIHGSEVCFRKFLAAAKVYQPDVLLLGGDFAGKAIVPVLRRGDAWSTLFNDVETTVPLEDYDQLAADITRRGSYPVRMDEEEYARLNSDSGALEELFRTEIAAQAQRWCDLAAERLDPAVRLIITPGNDDPWEADSVFDGSDRVEFPSLRTCEVGPFTMASVGIVPTTPWNTERECSEEELAKRIDDLLEPLAPDTRLIMNFHCPPYGSTLDDAPELDATLKPVIRGGRPSIVPVGSHAVRDAIKKYQPGIALHGHIHESRGVQKIGRTLCINPGSDYSSGVLRGAVVDLAEDGTCMDFLLTTG
ncbi:MAG TPA: metallophosphoesterase [Streptosporangiaceae bacterium]|nr:metallophosphoesterase [Streptosporangiaceae bacterium]